MRTIRIPMKLDKRPYSSAFVYERKGIKFELCASRTREYFAIGNRYSEFTLVISDQPHEEAYKVKYSGGVGVGRDFGQVRFLDLRYPDYENTYHTLGLFIQAYYPHLIEREVYVSIEL